MAEHPTATTSVKSSRSLPPSAWWLIAAGGLLRIAALLASRRELVTYRLPDDALYYFAIAKHITMGAGVSFDGRYPANGFHPLWMLLILPIDLLGLRGWSYIHGVLVLQTGIDILNLWLIAKLLRSLLADRTEIVRLQALLVAITVYALSATAIIRGINGLETTIAATMILLWTWVYCDLYQNGLGRNGALLRLSVVSAALFLARTDYAVVEVIAIALLALSRRRELKRAVPMVGVATVLFFVIVGPWLIWNYATFGSIVQASGNAVPFLAHKKLDVMFGATQWRFLLVEAARTILKPFIYCAFGLPLAAIVAMVICKSRKRSLEALSKTGLLPILFGVLILLAYHAIVRAMIRDWYILQLGPFIAVVFGVTVSLWLEARQNVVRWLWAMWVLVGVSLSLTAVIEFRTPRYESQLAMVEAGVPFVEQSRDVRIGALNSGYYGFFAPPSVLLQDLDGVVNSRILPFIYRGDLGGYLDHDSIDYILEFAPDLNGYRGLIDRRFTDKFEHADWLKAPGGRDSLELLRRIGVFHP